MTDNLIFFLNYNTIKQSILDRYNYFVSDGTEEASFFIKEIDSYTFKLRYKRSEMIDHSFDVIYKLYTDNKMRQASMLYEFYIGKSVNYLKQYVPNFVYTFGYNIRDSIFKEDDDINSLQVNKMVRTDQFILNKCL